MHVLICPDKYKGSLSAIQVANAIEKGLRAVDPAVEVDKVPMADGGDGTVEAFLAAMGGKMVRMEESGPEGNLVDAFYGLMENGQTAVIEMAAATGLTQVPRSRRNPMNMTSIGTGQLIRSALDFGVKKIIIGIGGSATNEGGMGMLHALGVRFFDRDGLELTTCVGREMLYVDRVDFSGLDARMKNIEIEVACDVNNPLCGPEGASAIFGPQKGATPEMITMLDDGLRRYAKLLAAETGIDMTDMRGAGAAGGMGGALVLIGGKLLMGTDIVIKATGLEARADRADLIITGEGATDRSTEFGKVPAAVGQLAKERNLPCLCIAGSVLGKYKGVYDKGVTAVFSAMNRPMRLEDAFNNAFDLIADCAENLGRVVLKK